MPMELPASNTPAELNRTRSLYLADLEAELLEPQPALLRLGADLEVAGLLGEDLAAL